MKLDQVGIQKWDYDRVITSHFVSPTQATPADVRACFAYLFEEELSPESKKYLSPIACQDWELLDSINQFIAKPTTPGDQPSLTFREAVWPIELNGPNKNKWILLAKRRKSK